MLIKSSSLGPEGWGLSEQEVHDLLSGDYQPKDELERACIDFVVAASTEGRKTRAPETGWPWRSWTRPISLRRW